jgi:hypothetical protein
MATPSSWSLPDGASVAIAPVAGGFTAQLYDEAGTVEGALFTAAQAHLGLVDFESLTALATGGYVLTYLHDGALLPAPYIVSATFAADGELLSQSQVSIPSAENGNFPTGPSQVYALPDGGFVQAWLDAPPYVGGFTGQLMVREFDSRGQPVEAAQALGQVAKGGYSLQVEADGLYTASWQSPLGPQQRAFMEQSAPLPFTLQSSMVLTASAGWTSGAVLANHAIAIVAAQDGGYGSHVGAEQTYDGSGHETASTALRGYAPPGQPLTPEVTSLGEGGYYQVNYAGSTDYEIYNAADQQVFVHNVWSNANGHFTALANGGYVVTDFPGQVMGLFDSANHNVGWFGLSGSTPESIVARADGGFDFVYSDHVLGYNAQGTLDVNSHLGFPPSQFASAAAALGGGVIGEVWLSPFEGQNGLATSIFFERIQSGPELRAIPVAQDLDPWHTSFALQAHADGSAAILWSAGGGVFAAEYANGAVGPSNQALAGALSTTVAIQLPDDMIGFAWFQNGDAWAEIFDPTTGVGHSADLGAASSLDISSLHALATASGGMAVSWHGASGVLGATLDGSGHASAAMNLPGDFLGVDAMGHAVTLHDQGGTPVLQTYAANDGLFWAV